MNNDNTHDMHQTLTNIQVMLGRLEERINKIHGDPCNDVIDLKESFENEVEYARKKFKIVFDKLELHNEKYHSENSLQNKWVAWAVIGCTVATCLSPFIQKWLT